MRIAVASDHAGLNLKAALVQHLRKRGHDVTDLGPSEGTSVDYPAFAEPLSRAVAVGGYERGVLVCGSGVGMSIAANKVAGVRAVLASDEWTARMSRAHNDANVLCLGERATGVGLALAIADAFVDAAFEGGRHQRRIDQLSDLDARRGA
jgi:ribose 5-phosphate isomerase B